MESAKGNVVKTLAGWQVRTGATQKQIAVELGISQSQVSKLLGGQIEVDAKLAKRIERFLDQVTRLSDQRGVAIHNAVLIDALNEVWDGSSEHALALSNVIRALKCFGSPRPGV